ncbi:MAG: MoaD/ThiS family protein [Anaerolineae bacterium]
MQVHVKLHSILRDYLPRAAKGKASLTLDEGATVAHLLQRLQITRRCIVMVNGKEISDWEHMLRDGDDVHMLVALGGGT